MSPYLSLNHPRVTLHSFIGVRGGEAPCARLAIRIRESELAVDQLSSVTNLPILPLLCAKKITNFRDFCTPNRHTDAHLDSFGPILAPARRSVTELRAGAKIEAKLPERSPERRSRVFGVIATLKEKVAKS